MFINKVISFQGGWEILSNEKNPQMLSILNSLQCISPEVIAREMERELEIEVMRYINTQQIADEFLDKNKEEMLASDDETTRAIAKNRATTTTSEAREIIKKKYKRLKIDIDSKSGIKKLLQRRKHSTIINNFIARTWDQYITNTGWTSSKIEVDYSEKDQLFIKHLQERSSVKLSIVDSQRLANWVYVETQKIHEADICDVAIILAPMDSFKKNYMGNRFSENSFESLSLEFNELSPIKSLAPLVIIGFSEIESDFEIRYSTSSNTNNEINSIDKCIEFSPEHYQAGMGILSYFGEIIKTKHPDIQASVKIEQDGNFVRLHIETEDGTKEIIEKTLEDYTLVVSNQAPVEILFDNKLEIMALKNKLEIASMEVRQTRDMLTLSREHSNERVLSLEEDIQHLRSQIGSQMSLTSQGNKIIEMQMETSDKMVNGLVESSQHLIKDLIKQTPNNSEVREALNLINNKLESGITENDEIEVKSAIEIVNESAPSVFKDLKIALKNTSYGVSGNFVYKWLVDITNMIC